MGRGDFYRLFRRNSNSQLHMRTAQLHHRQITMKTTAKLQISRSANIKESHNPKCQQRSGPARVL